MNNKAKVYFKKRKDLAYMKGTLGGLKVRLYDDSWQSVIYEGVHPSKYSDKIKIVKPFEWKGMIIESINVEYLTLKEVKEPCK